MTQKSFLRSTKVAQNTNPALQLLLAQLTLVGWLGSDATAAMSHVAQACIRRDLVRGTGDPKLSYFFRRFNFKVRRDRRWGCLFGFLVTGQVVKDFSAPRSVVS